MTTSRLISAICRASSAPVSVGSKGWDQNFAAALQQGRENRWGQCKLRLDGDLSPARKPDVAGSLDVPA
jgi:hypothetical protein